MSRTGMATSPSPLSMLLLPLAVPLLLDSSCPTMLRPVHHQLPFCTSQLVHEDLASSPRIRHAYCAQRTLACSSVSQLMPSGSCPSARCSILMQGWQALVATAFFLQASSNVFPSHAPRPRYASGPRAFLLPTTSGHQQFQFAPQAAPVDLMSPSNSCVHASMLLFPIKWSTPP